jgi:hypothetical protein
MALELPSRNAVRLALSAEKELFAQLGLAVKNVRDHGSWRTLSGNAGEQEAVENWLTTAWYDGFVDDAALVTAWGSALPAGDNDPAPELRDAAETEKNIVEKLLSEVETAEADLSASLSKKTLQAWIKDLDGEIRGKEEIIKHL